MRESPEAQREDGLETQGPRDQHPAEGEPMQLDLEDRHGQEEVEAVEGPAWTTVGESPRVEEGGGEPFLRCEGALGAASRAPSPVDVSGRFADAARLEDVEEVVAVKDSSIPALGTATMAEPYSPPSTPPAKEEM